jgi:hypothetical protein
MIRESLLDRQEPTITMDEKVYVGLRSVVSLESAYREMAEDQPREAAALKWSEGTLGDVGHETRRSIVGEL